MRAVRRFCALSVVAIVIGVTSRSAFADDPPPLPPPEPPPSSSIPPISPATPVSPLSPPPERARPHRATPNAPEYDESTFVTVTVDADAPGVYLEALTEHDGWMRLHWRSHTEVVYGRTARWRPVCAAPCTMRVPPDLRYRVAGPNVPASDEIAIGPPGGERRLHVSAGSRGWQAAGAVLLVLGIPTAIVGVAIAATSREDDTRNGGIVTLGVGAALIAGGAVLMATNGTGVNGGEARPTVGAAGLRIGKSTWLTPVGLVF